MQGVSIDGAMWCTDGSAAGGYPPWLFIAIQSGFQSISLFEDGAIQILELSGCFRTAGPVFQDILSLVQDGSGLIFSRFSLISPLSYHLIIVSVVSVVSRFSPFQVSAVQNKTFSRSG
jgi:hypothetical protein